MINGPVEALAEGDGLAEADGLVDAFAEAELVGWPPPPVPLVVVTIATALADGLALALADGLGCADGDAAGVSLGVTNVVAPSAVVEAAGCCEVLAGLCGSWTAAATPRLV